MGRAHPCLPAGLPRAARSPHSRPVPRTAILGQLPALAAHALPRSPTSENGWRPTGSGRVAPALGGFILLLLYSWRRGFCSEALRDFSGKQRGGCSLGPLHRQEVFNRYLSPWLYGNCRLRDHISRMFSFKGNFCRHRLCYIACPLFDPPVRGAASGAAPSALPVSATSVPQGLPSAGVLASFISPGNTGTAVTL